MWPYITYNTHQVARFSSNPRYSHREAVVQLEKYLRCTITVRIYLILYKNSFSILSDTDFYKNWHRVMAETYSSTDKS